MAPSVSISILAAWALCIFMHATTIFIAAGSVAASESSALELEAKALLGSGWWSRYSNDTLKSRCEWDGITCDFGGSVQVIDMAWVNLGGKISKFNFSSFPT